MDGVSGLEEGTKVIFPNIIVQRCIIHLIRNSIRYIPSKDYKRFTQSLKKVYDVANEKALFKSLYLRIKELTKKWERGHVSNWSMVLNQLMIDDNFKNRIERYMNY